MAELHITNGDSAANIIKESPISGDVLPWRDPMHHGPFPAGLDLDAVSDLRGRYLAGPALDSQAVQRDFRLRNAHLRAAPTYDRVVLWFEHDLLDQLQILQLLDFFTQGPLGNGPLEMICIDRFAGISPFRGIGQLNPAQMASLYELRQPLRPDQLKLATNVWAAFRSDDPRHLAAFLDLDLRDLPFLKAALSRYFEEFPNAETGLSRTETQILRLIADGICDPTEVFLANMAFETALYIGDWRTFHHIASLCGAKEPLIACASGKAFFHPPLSDRSGEAFRRQELRLTKTGEELLAGQRTAFHILQRDEWLGGVRLQSSGPLWTWNAAQGHLQLRDG